MNSLAEIEIVKSGSRDVAPGKLLYIENDTVDRTAFLRLVREKTLPYDMTCAESLAEARACLAESRFDIIVTDYHLPDGSGTELLGEVSETPLVLMAENLGEQLALRTRERGADDYLSKDPEHRHVDALPFIIEKALHRKLVREREQRLMWELRESEERFRLLVEGVKDCSIVLLDEEGRLVTWNSGSQQMNGYTADEVLGGSFSRFYTPEDQAADKPSRSLTLALKHGSYIEETWTVRKDGTRFWSSVTITSLPARFGRVGGFARVTRDLTQDLLRQEADESLSRSQERLRLATEGAQLGTWDWDLISGTLIWSWGCFELFGMSPDSSATYQRFLDALHPDDRVRIGQAIRECLEKHQDYDVELRTIRGDGALHWIAARGRPYYEPSGRPVRMSGVVMDITDRKRTELALAATQAQLRTVTDTMAVGVARCSRDSRYLWVSPAYARWLGRPPEEIAGRPMPEVIGEAAYAIFRPHIARVLTGQKVEYEAHVEYQGRGLVWINAVYTPTFDAAGLADGWVGVITDITERKQAEATIARLASFPERNPNPIIEVDLDGRVYYGNPAARQLYPDLEHLGSRHPFLAGMEAAAAPFRVGQDSTVIREVTVAGRTFQQTLYFLPEDARVRIYSMEITERRHAQEVQSRLAAIVESSDDAIISKNLDGIITTWNAGAERLFDYRPEEMIGQPITRIIPPELQEEEIQLLNRLRRGERIDHFATVRIAKGGRRVDVSLTISPVRNGNGEIIGVSKTCRDITERKRREAALRRARGALVRANENLEKQVEERTARLKESVAELEGFSYSLVHDMRAPLRAMQSFATLLEESSEDLRRNPESQDYLRRIRQASSRMDKLVTDALNYSRVIRDDLPLQPVDLAHLLRGMIDSYPELGPPAADIKVDFEDLLVQGNESALTQAFSSLLSNAVKFVAPGIKPQVRIWAQDGGPEEPFVRIWVEDNGIGISREARRKIFGMFQRLHTESEYPGTGIGLAIVRKALQRTGGRVGLESEPGQGSKFWVELPKVL